MTDPERWGVATGYTDAGGRYQEIEPETIDAVLAAMGAGATSPPGPGPAGSPLMVRAGKEAKVGRGRLTTEDGGDVAVDSTLPPDLPPGYHTFEAEGGLRRLVIASPGRCPLPSRRRWGWAVQLYATRSGRSWGFGDLADLAEVGRWSASLGAGLVLINPLHASAPGPHLQASPYYPASRCFRSPLYLRVEAVPGAAAVDLGDLAASGRALNARPVIDRQAVWALKSQALERIFAATAAGREVAEFEAFVSAGGRALERFARWCALAELHGVPWQEWPAPYRHPDNREVGALAASPEGRLRVRYHQWLQWLLDRQLADVPAEVGVVQDLAIGVDPGGADAWMWQDVFASGMRVGAPPDEFNTRGQDWGLPPFDPWKLRAAAYGPFVETVRSGLRHAGGLRIDHVMGLFRLWWIPEGNSPADGAYVAYPSADLLDIVALEAHRAGAYVVGEDLGTVEPGVREDLAERAILSYRVLWFEDDKPTTWPERALAAVSTHDLPTVAGAWTGSDLQAQRDLGLQPNEEGSEQMRQRLEDWTASPAGTPISEVVLRTYRLLGQAPALLVAATLDDVCQVEERPNVPGTTDERPNWSLALPHPLEEIERLPLAAEVAAALEGPMLPGRGSPRDAAGGAHAGQGDA
jgi:4-alpha-glucanotransferase